MNSCGFYYPCGEIPLGFIEERYFFLSYYTSFILKNCQDWHFYWLLITDSLRAELLTRNSRFFYFVRSVWHFSFRSRVRARLFLQFLQITAAGLRPAVNDVTPLWGVGKGLLIFHHLTDWACGLSDTAWWFQWMADATCTFRHRYHWDLRWNTVQEYHYSQCIVGDR